MGNSASIQISDLTRIELVEIIKKICFNNEEEPIYKEGWHEMSEEQLRTVVVLLDNDMLDLIEAWRRRPADVLLEQMTPYAPCNVLKYLYEWTRTSSNARDPVNHRPITHYQRLQIASAYFATLSPAERLLLENENENENELPYERHIAHLERVDQVLESSISNFRRLGVRWEVDGEAFGDTIEFEEYFIGSAAYSLNTKRDVLLSYLRHVYLGVQQWGDFEVWRHLRRQDMLENDELIRVQFLRILQGLPPVDFVRERELFDEWRPQNAQAMNDMWTIFRRYAVLYAIGMIEEQMVEEEDWTDFEIWRHFMRGALLTDPNEAMMQYTRLQGIDSMFQQQRHLDLRQLYRDHLFTISEEDERRLFMGFIQNNQEKMRDMRRTLMRKINAGINAFDLTWWR